MRSRLPCLAVDSQRSGRLIDVAGGPDGHAVERQNAVLGTSESRAFERWRFHATSNSLAWVEERAIETRMKDPDGGRMIRVGDQKAVIATFTHETSRKHVLVAWTQTREASRAVADSLPILEKADEVTVVTVHAPKMGGFATSEFLTYLSRHGVRAQGHHEVAPDAHVGDALVEAADMCGADLVVMGACGHSRLREVAFGGATHHVLDHTTVPVLMAH